MSMWVILNITREFKTEESDIRMIAETKNFFANYVLFLHLQNKYYTFSFF